MRRQLLITDEGVVDAVVGYRAWEVHAVDGVVHLTSVVRREVEWLPGETVRAECRCNGYSYRYPYASYVRRDDQWHTCGIYAWASPVVPYTPRLLGHDGSSAVVCGEVLLWGTVRRHERGYRGQSARLSALYVHAAMADRRRRMVDLAALQFDVPVVLVDKTWDVGPRSGDEVPVAGPELML